MRGGGTDSKHIHQVLAPGFLVSPRRPGKTNSSSLLSGMTTCNHILTPAGQTKEPRSRSNNPTGVTILTKYEILTTPQRYESETAKACQTCWIVSDPILVCLEPHDIMFDLISYLISYVMSFLHTSRMQSFVTLSIMENSDSAAAPKHV